MWWVLIERDSWIGRWEGQSPFPSYACTLDGLCGVCPTVLMAWKK